MQPGEGYEDSPHLFGNWCQHFCLQTRSDDMSCNLICLTNTAVILPVPLSGKSSKGRQAYLMLDVDWPDVCFAHQLA